MNEQKIHYRAYKKGKFWVYAIISASFITLSSGKLVSADEQSIGNTAVTAVTTVETTEKTSRSVVTPIETTADTTVPAEGSAEVITDTIVSSEMSAEVTTDPTTPIETSAISQPTSAAIDKAVSVTSTTESDSNTSQSSEKVETGWNFDASSNEQTAVALEKIGIIQGTNSNYNGLIIDASQTGAKFAPRATDTQVNAGTVLSLPIQSNTNGAQIKVSLSGGTTSLHTSDGQNFTNLNEVIIDLPASSVSNHYQFSFDQTSYLSGINISYHDTPVVFPGTPENVAAVDKIWDLATNADRPNSQGDQSQTFQGIKIDTTQAGAKFAPRASDTQINAGTILYIPLASNQYGASLALTISGGTTALHVDQEASTTFSGTTILDIPVSKNNHYLALNFDETAYLKDIQLNYKTAPVEFPGTPENVAAVDKIWDLATSADRPNSQGDQSQTFQGIKIDTTQAGAKFAPRATDTQINAGTILYIPVAANQYGAALNINLSGGTTTARLGQGENLAFSGTSSFNISASESDQYLALTFEEAAYLQDIQLTYGAAPVEFPGTPENVAAVDKIWDLATSADRPNSQGDQSQTFQGIKIDTTQANAKFAPRTTDTQVNAGTILYIPIAADKAGAVLSVKGNNYNNLTVTLDGRDIQLGSDTIIDTTSDRYIPLVFSSNDNSGSAYLSAIEVDYISDKTEKSHSVTVGKNGQYHSIQEALDNNMSSLKDRLILEIEPGDYHEKVTVNQPGVTFVNTDSTNQNKVVIRSSYYSSNHFDANGVFQPQDAYDYGTDQSATVIVNASATGFSAYGITFQNDYNIINHTGQDEQTPAVAFNSKADKITIQDSAFIGRQDTLYLQGDGNRVVIVNSYIEGTVDFIFGNADAYIKDSQIFMAYYPGRKNGYFTAPNTAKGYTGLVFDNSIFEVSDQYPAKATITLARPWQTEITTQSKRSSDGTTKLISYDHNSKNPSYLNTSSAITLINSTVSDRISDNRFSAWTRKDKKGNLIDVTYHPDVRFVEFNSQLENGEAITPHAIPLGIMANGDEETYRNQLLKQMNIGSEIGQWDADLESDGQGKLTVSYIDELTGTILDSQELSGTYGTKVDYQTADTIQRLTQANYVLVKDTFSGQKLYYSLANKNKTYEIYFTHATDRATEDKVVTQTVHYTDQNGNSIAAPALAKLQFTRDVITDRVNQQVTYGDWVAVNGTTFEAVISPEVIGYTANAKRVERIKNVTADSTNLETTIIYTPISVDARIVFIDDTTGKTLSSQKISGKYGSTSSYQTSDSIQKYEAKGYRLVSNDYPQQGFVFNSIEEPSFTVHLAHTFTTTDEEKTVTQSIFYVNEKGKKVADDHVTSLNFKRQATRDNVTKKVTYSDWIASNGTSFAAVTSPEIIGHIANQSQVTGINNVSATQKDIKTTVTYKPTIQSATISFIDDTTGQLISTKTITGKYGDKISYSPSSDIKSWIKKGYVLVSSQSPKKGEIFDQDKVVKEYQIHLTHSTVTVSADKPKKPGSPLYSGSQVKWPLGTDKDSLTKTITRTIYYVYQDGKKAPKSKTDSITYSRELVLDGVTGEILTDKGWKTPKSQTFKAVKIPIVKGYTASIATISATEVTPQTNSFTQTVIYTATPKPAKKGNNIF